MNLSILAPERNFLACVTAVSFPFPGTEIEQASEQVSYSFVPFACLLETPATQARNFRDLWHNSSLWKRVIAWG